MSFCWFHADTEDSDVQVDLSLCWAHMSFCLFCPALAQFICTGRELTNFELEKNKI